MKLTHEYQKFDIILIDLFILINFPIVNKFVIIIQYLITSYDH